MKWMDVDIALASVPVNIMPLVDDTDFKTIEAAVVYNQSGLALFWNFTTTAGVTTVTAVTPTTSGVYDWTDFTTSGMYGIEIPASGGASANNDTEGVGHFTGVATGVLPWRGPDIGFRAAATNDALIDLDTLITSLDVGQLYQGTISTVTNQTNHIMNVALATDDVWIGQTATVEDVSTGEPWVTWVSDIVASSNTIVLGETPPYTVVAGDIIRVRDVRHPRYELEDFDPPKRSELSTDTASILAKMLNYVQLIVRKDAAIATDNSAEMTAINADESSGAGTYDNETDSLEATQDDITVVDGVVDSILADTNPIKVKTDQLTFSSAGYIDSNIMEVNDNGGLTGDGEGTPIRKT